VVTRNRVAVIPARGGSRRIPRKNVVDFHGKPMLTWTVEAAAGSGAFERIVVSTEDAGIAAIARDAGAEVPFLRRAHFDDHAHASTVTVDVLAQLREHFGEDYRQVVQLMPNCPLRTAGDIAAAVAAFEAGGAEFQISCARFGMMSAWWALKRDPEGGGHPMFPEALALRSQDLPPLYYPSGAIWIAKAAALVRHGDFYGPGYRLEPLSWISAVDIDDPDDLDFARAAWLVRKGDSAGGIC
jgi:N-acylneuraminate cytidylyltransferase